MSGENDKTIIGSFSKNQREVIVVYLDNDLCHVRTHYPNEAGELQPTGKGIAIQVRKLDALIAILADARAECARRGLIEGAPNA